MNKRTIVFVGTFVSFIVLIAYGFFGFIYIISKGNWDTGNISMGEIIVNSIFTLLQITNGICVVLSIVVAGKTVYNSIHDRQIGLRQLRDFVLGVYPLLLLLFICSFDFSKMVYAFFVLPIQFLYRFILLVITGTVPHL